MSRMSVRLLGVLAGLLLLVPTAAAQMPEPTRPAAPVKPSAPGAAAASPKAGTAPAAPKPARMGLAMPDAVLTGDLDGMIGRRQIRVLVPYSKTFYFVDKGQPRGVSYDALSTFEETLNRKLKTKNLRVHVVFIPTSRDRLLPALAEGKGDVVAANLTITEDRLAVVDFTDPLLTGINEIVVTGPGSPTALTSDDLGRRKIFVRKSSSYWDSLETFNEERKKAGKPEAVLVPAPEQLEDEDLLEMLNAGLIKTVVVDSHKAAFWKQIFPKLVVHGDVALRTGGQIAWAIRKGSPKLKAELNAFIKTHGENSAFGKTVLRKYLKDTRYVKDAASEAEMRKFRSLVGLFRKYGDQYGMDWMLMAAQGYQESRLDQTARSHVGAIGVMQVMPQTGKELKVGDITKTEPNIHAGVKYIRFMVDQYYGDEPMTDLDKGLFAFAAYNCGAGRVNALRREAEKRGIDRNVWFDNVERVAADKIGRETVTYVSNIYKYYIAYRLVQGEYLEREAAKKSLRETKP
jgi:membrane-bound lytic murein transglycosylase MltF